MIIKLAQFESEMALEKDAGSLGRITTAKGRDIISRLLHDPKSVSLGEAAYLESLNAGRQVGRHVAFGEQKVTQKINSNIGKAVDYLKEKGSKAVDAGKKAGEHIKRHSGGYAIGGGAAAAGAAGLLASRNK